jgi:adhesin/invasin
LSVLLAVLAFATLASCDKIPLTAPTESTITLTISTTVVPINGSAEIIASVIESAGTPVHNGTIVTFTASFGTVEPREAQTVGGTARAKFTGTSSGVATISAFSGSAVATLEDVRVGGAAAERVAVRTDPATVPQAGGTVQVIAIVTDASGNALPGAPVVFTTDNGILASNSGVTDSTGQAQTSLTTNRQTVITANVAGKEGRSTINVVNAPTVSITSTANPLVGVPVSFTVTPSSPTGGSPIQTVAIDFGDGSAVQNLGTPTGATSVAHTFSTAGSFVVTATVIDAIGQKATATATIVVLRILPTITLVPTPATVAAGGTVTFAVTAAAATGGPPLREVIVTENGTVVFRGTGSGSFARQFNSAGTFTFQASATDAAGSTATTTTTVVVTGPTSTAMTLDASSSTTNRFDCTAFYPKTCQGVDLKAGTDVILAAGFLGTTPSGITQFSWSFGNGQGTTTSGPSVVFKYPASGTYVASVTALSGSSVVGSQTIVLIVVN